LENDQVRDGVKFLRHRLGRVLDKIRDKTVTTGHVVVRPIPHSPAADTYFDTFGMYAAGVVRISGWSLKPTRELSHLAELMVNGRPLGPSQVFRTYRPDIRVIVGAAHDYSGVVIEFVLPLERICSIALHTPNTTLSFEIADLGIQFFEAPYRGLFRQDQVLHREQIYGYGPPNDETPVEILSATSRLSGTILDFGCGNGALVRRLRARGLDTLGLELDRAAIRDSLAPDVQPYVTLYDGQLPAPYAAKSFDCVVAVEVIEHLPDLVPAIAELARIARSEVLLTTPDISAIPLLSAENVVPWHLLESTHLNFFTQPSLERLLREHFEEIELGRISPNTINNTRYWTSLMVWCRGPIGNSLASCE
jgi:SAM-dependent methyltransferase